MTATPTQALTAYTGRDLEQLAALGGLPGALPLNQAAAVLGADPDRCRRWFLGDPPQEAFWCAAAVEGYDGQVKIWFRDGQVVKLAGERPQLAPDAVAVLGPPELRLDYRAGVRVIAGGEHIWPSHGLAVRMNATGDRPLQLTVFVPTTEADYRETVQDYQQYREFPDEE
jgi:hypothetical protein